MGGIVLRGMNCSKNFFCQTVSLWKNLSEKLIELERMVDRLHYCVSLLEDRQAQVIRLYHFEKKTWEEIADSMVLSVRTVQKTKSAAVDKLVEMYCYVQNIGKS